MAKTYWEKLWWQTFIEIKEKQLANLDFNTKNNPHKL